MGIYKYYLKYRFVLLIVSLFFVLFELVIVSTVKYKESEDISTFLEFKSKELGSQVKMSEHYLSIVAQLLYDNFIESEETAEIMYKASQTDNLEKQAVLRAKLYKKYQQDYEYMKRLGVRQLHFHLPGPISFLRFHRPSKYGDSLVGIRESLMYVNKYKKPLECFEEGRIFNGFRHIYPIFYKEQFVGTVEISYSFRAFLEHMLEINREASYLFLVNDKAIGIKVFQDEKSNYIRSAFKHYSIDKKTLNNSMGLSLNDIFAINKNISSEVSEKVLSEENFSVAAYMDDLQNKSVLASFIAVRNFDKKKVAYMVGYTYSITIDIIHKRSAQILVVLSAFNLIVTLLIFILLKNQKRKIEHVAQEAIQDPLTKILNRRGFDNMLENKISISKRYQSDLSVIFFDIDHFKKINDTYGHDVGDIILKELAILIKGEIRESDIFARWGGEEFIVLLPNTPLKDAVLLSEKLQKAIKSYNFTHIEKLTCSFGVTQLDQQEDAQEFLKRADRLLYRAKEEGRDKIVSGIN